MCHVLINMSLAHRRKKLTMRKKKGRGVNTHTDAYPTISSWGRNGTLALALSWLWLQPMQGMTVCPPLWYLKSSFSAWETGAWCQQTVATGNILLPAQDTNLHVRGRVLTRRLEDVPSLPDPPLLLSGRFSQLPASATTVAFKSMAGSSPWGFREAL